MASLVLVKESKPSINPTLYPTHLLVLDRNKVPFGSGLSSIPGEEMNCSSQSIHCTITVALGPHPWCFMV